MKSVQAHGRVLIDTGAFAAGAIRREINHGRAVAILNMLMATARPLLTTNLVVAETHALVLARAGRALALQTLHQIDWSVDVLRVTDEDELAGRAILARYTDKDFSLADAISFAVMDRLGIRDTFTFDRHFAQYGFNILQPS